MVTPEKLEWAIEQHYKNIDSQNHQRTLTKNWCLAVWLPVLIILISGKFIAIGLVGFVLSFLPILLFWLIEGLHASQMKIMELRVVELERLLLNDESRIKRESDILFYGSHQYQSPRVKLNMFAYAIFKMETVVAFYAILISVNLLVNILSWLTS